MRILIAPDSLKESLSSPEAAACIARGIKSVDPDAETILLPLADGGEGTVRAMAEATGGEIIEAQTHDPLMRKITSFYGVLGDGKTAVIEVAASSGLELLKRNERNPLLATSYGTGELISAALDRGYRKFIIGLGGSAVNDGGAGIAQALGIKLKDSKGTELSQGAGELSNLAAIDASAFDKRITGCSFVIACDVDNPLTGPRGASAVFGPQKGATPEMIHILDASLNLYADFLQAHAGKDVRSIPGSGAAGGIAATLMAFFPSEIRPGFSVISKYLDLETKIAQTDLVITAEGRVDRQTLSGKAPAGIAALCRKFRKPLFIFTGSVAEDMGELYEAGVSAIIPLCDRPLTLEEAINQGGVLLERATERTFRIFYKGVDQGKTFL